LILLAIPLASRRRPVLLGVLACLYALGYTAFQAFLGLCLLFFLCTLWVERRAEWRLVVYPAIGVALGLLVHPQFPANVRVWLVPLAVLRSMQAAGEAPGPFVRLPARGRVSFALAFSLCLVSAAPLVRLGLGRMQAAMSRIWRPDMRADWEAFARAMPDGAKVAAPWAATEAFVFWAPRAAYLNVLDPLFMAARDAATYRLYLDLFEGREPDIPLPA